MKIGMLFPGYGKQFVGMAKELYDESRLMQEYFEEASSCLDRNFVKLCFASSEADLTKMENAYVSIFLVSSAIAALLKEQGIVPDAMIGYGLGEYSALCTGGGLSLPDGLYFLSKYAQFYSEVLESTDIKSLYISGMKYKDLVDVCADISTEKSMATVAVCISNTSCIVTGHAQAVDKIEEVVSKNPSKIIIKNSPLERGLHSQLMSPVVENLSVYLEKIDFKDMQIPLIASYDGNTVEKGSLIRDRIMKKINSPMRWDKVLKLIYDWDLIIEVGPGTTLSESVGALYPEKRRVSINTPEDVEMLKAILAEEKEKNSIGQDVADGVVASEEKK